VARLTSDKRQKNQLVLAFREESRSEAPRASEEGTESLAAKCRSENPAIGERLMEEVCERENCKQALARVKANKGSPGVDGVTIHDLPGYLKQHWPAIREQLLSGTYVPQPVRRVEIPKPDGGVRKLGIPTVLDRFIQQAVMQVLQGKWDRTFSQHSYGFRPGRSAHQAVEQAQQYIAEGYRFVVDRRQSGGQRPRSVAVGKQSGPRYRAAQRLLYFARDSTSDRFPVAQPTESPYTDPYVR
jgi:RNA-directed DNA polymerase